MSRLPWAPRLIVAAYPPSFRHRYGDELASVVSETGDDARSLLDLALGAVRAWVNPVFVGVPEEHRRDRLQATVATVFVAWCASLIAGAGFARTVDDPPLPGLHGLAWTSYNAGLVVLQVLAGVVLLAGFAFWIVVVLPAARSRRREVLGPALAPAGLVAIWLVLTGGLALFAHRYLRNGVYIGPVAGLAAVAAFAAWGAATVACAIGSAASAVTALRRAGLTAPQLVPAVVVAGLATVGVAAQTAAALVCLFTVVGPHGRVGGLVQPAAPALLLLASTAVAAVSSVRGIVALRAR